MSHYDCRECGAGPMEDCECRKAAERERKASWARTAATYRDAERKVRCIMGAKDEDDSDREALGTILMLAERRILDAERYAL